MQHNLSLIFVSINNYFIEGFLMKPRRDDKLLSGLYLTKSLMYFILHVAIILQNDIKHDLLVMSHCEKWQILFRPEIISQQNIH